jgi:hypothetical protein
VTKLADVDRGTRTRPGDPTLALRDLLLRIEAEYREMPGLSLTVSQAQRLWGLDRSTCALVLVTLVERRVLRQTPNGRFVRVVES